MFSKDVCHVCHAKIYEEDNFCRGCSEKIIKKNHCSDKNCNTEVLSDDNYCCRCGSVTLIGYINGARPVK